MYFPLAGAKSSSVMACIPRCIPHGGSSGGSCTVHADEDRRGQIAAPVCSSSFATTSALRKPDKISPGQTERSESSEVPSNAQANVPGRMSFKGQPDQDGFKRRVMTVTAMMGTPTRKLFGNCRDKENIYRDATDQDPLFAGALKTNTTRSKWHESRERCRETRFGLDVP